MKLAFQAAQVFFFFFSLLLVSQVKPVYLTAVVECRRLVLYSPGKHTMLMQNTLSRRLPLFLEDRESRTTH